MTVLVGIWMPNLGNIQPYSMRLSARNQAMLKSWLKVFGAGVVALAISGERDPKALLAAGLAAVLPVVYTWLDPKDKRFGKGA